jgi:hypothetical protein
MAIDYWISFRLEDGRTYSDRYDGLTAAFRKCGTLLWEETTSFVLLRSTLNIDQLAAALSKPIDLDTDMILVRELNAKSARIAGVFYDKDLLEFLPYLKYA